MDEEQYTPDRHPTDPEDMGTSADFLDVESKEEPDFEIFGDFVETGITTAEGGFDDPDPDNQTQSWANLDPREHAYANSLSPSFLPRLRQGNWIVDHKVQTEEIALGVDFFDNLSLLQSKIPLIAGRTVTPSLIISEANKLLINYRLI